MFKNSLIFQSFQLNPGYSIASTVSYRAGLDQVCILQPFLNKLLNKLNLENSTLLYENRVFVSNYKPIIFNIKWFLIKRNNIATVPQLIQYLK